MNVQLKASVVIATIILAIQACAPSESLQVKSSRDALPEDCEVMVYTPGQDKPETKPDQDSPKEPVRNPRPLSGYGFGRRNR